MVTTLTKNYKQCTFYFDFPNNHQILKRNNLTANNHIRTLAAEGRVGLLSDVQMDGDENMMFQRVMSKVCRDSSCYLANN